MKKIVSQLFIGSLILASPFVMIDQADAKKKNSSSGLTMSSEQRAKVYAKGLADCRKAYGDRLSEVHIEKFYGKFSVVCYHF